MMMVIVMEVLKKAVRKMMEKILLKS